MRGLRKPWGGSVKKILLQCNGEDGHMAHTFQCLVSPSTGRPVPAVIVSVGMPRVVPPASKLFEVMLSYGWTLASAPVPVSTVVEGAVVAQLAVNTSGMQLTTGSQVNDAVLTAQDTPPDLPAAWWESVHRQGSHCTVIVVDVIDLARPRKLRKYIDSAARRKAVLIGRAVVITSNS